VTNPHGDHALDCAHARELIDAFLLDELESTDAARLAAHVKGCPACAAEIGGSTRVLGLLGSLGTPRPMPDFDERILVAAFEDRRRRHDHRSWLSDLRTQVIRGAMRTTGTLMVTIATVALIAVAGVFAASQVVSQFPPFVARATLAPVATPTLTPAPAVPTASPGSATATPRPSSGASATPTTEPTPVPTPSPEPSATPELSASPSPSEEPSASPTPTAEPTPTPTAEPTPSPTPSPSPTDKRRTPPPSFTPSP
jgi:hypothetical protein